eukprot:TRINITY_DN1543_c0_g1_i1.p5 TRINITY_DN1543_c0_g1~~TRINITY_DN1543_c0_g1_i1.p5  ORF type:complete len:580 (-),score=94.06 TRINITY_DN1543_c0_g1_i1:7221-8960(-)
MQQSFPQNNTRIMVRQNVTMISIVSEGQIKSIIISKEAKMEKKRSYTKTIILGKYKAYPLPAQFDKPITQKLGIYSETALEPVSLKMPYFASEMLYVQRSRISPHHPKPMDVKAENAKEPVKEKVVKEKMAIFSFVSSFVGLDPKVETWYYSDSRERNVPYKGPMSAESMDKMWREDKLSLSHTTIYSNDISFMSPTTGEYTKKELKLDQFVPMEMLLEHTIFSKIKGRGKSTPVASAPAPKPVAASASKPASESASGSISTPASAPAPKPVAVLEPAANLASTPVPKPEEKKQAKKANNPKKKENKKESKKLAKEERGKHIASAEDEGFTIVESKKKTKQKKGKAGKVEEEYEEIEEESLPGSTPQVSKPVEALKKQLEVKSQTVEHEESSSSEEEGFEYIPSKAKAKRMKKKKKTGKVEPVVVQEEPMFVPEPVEAKPVTTPVKEEPKKTEPEKPKPEVKVEPPKTEVKKEQKTQPKKKKGKKEADPALLGLYFEKPKKEVEEPETWGTVPAEPKKVVPLEELMKEEAIKAQTQAQSKPQAKKKKQKQSLLILPVFHNNNNNSSNKVDIKIILYNVR